MKQQPNSRTQDENGGMTGGGPLELTAIPVPQAQGRVQFVTTLSAEQAHDLISRGLMKVDIWSHPSNLDGYQRSPVESRIRKFARYVQAQDGSSPVSVLLFYRWPEKVTVESGPDGTKQLRLDLDEKHPLYIPDGQHRLLGLKQAFEADQDGTREYHIPVVLMLAESGDEMQARYEEATQFYTINNYQKRVATDLAQRYRLRVQEKMAGKIAPSAVLPVNANLKELEPYCLAAIDLLNKSPGPWHDLIDLPNAPGSNRPISQNSFLDSIRPLVRFASDYGWTVGKVVETMDAFWTAVEHTCPEAMAHWHDDGHAGPDHETYVVRTTAGAYSLNELLSWLIGWHKIQGDPANVELYEALLNKDPEHFSDEFWNSDGSEGAATYGTSRKAFRELRFDIQKEIQEHLTEI